ncbi:MAG: radical SAM protein [Candidatus Omnitrophica bacterium]|nr:radical SAM protein [Candidatus Omnitrophota bacterium]
MTPSYISLHENGILDEIKNKLLEELGSCDLCPHKCKVNRNNDETGFCEIGRLAKVSNFFLHFGEEQELVGEGGSGTIFFSGCNLRCIFCQNYTLSHLGEGQIVTPQELAGMMLVLQNNGAENINFVTPTQVIAQIIEALPLAINKGLTLPLVYNCGGYENPEVLRLIKGIFDIYMPDIKYADDEIAAKFSCAPDYWEKVKTVIKEMYSQVGDLLIEEGIAKRGLLLRHLVLPQRLAGSFEILDFIKEEISLDTYVNIMEQYRPCYRAGEFKELSRRLTDREYEEVIEYAQKIGLYRGFPHPLT